MDSSAPIVAILPFAFPESREDHEGIIAAQGIATMIESRLRMIPRARVFVQHLLLAPQEGRQEPQFIVRSSMWPLQEALELPAPEGSRPTHILQGSLRLGEIIEAELELIDVNAAYASFRKEISASPALFLEQFFAALGQLAEAIRPDLPINQRIAITRQPTGSFDAFRNFIIGLARRIHRQMGSELTARLTFEPFLKALTEDPDFVEPCIALDVLAQEALAHRVKDEELVSILREASQRAPQYLGFRRTLGIHLFDEGRYEEARTYLEEFVEKTEERAPTAAAAFVRLAAIYHQTNGLTKAKQLLSDAMRRFPDNPDVRESLGVCLAESGKWKEAEACWRKVLEEYPRRATSLSNLAVICWKNQDHDRADILFARSIESPDATEQAYNRYIEFLLEREKLERADQVATERVELYSNQWRHWVQLAHVRRRLGQHSAAEHCLNQAEQRATPKDGGDEIDIARFALHHPAEFPVYIAAVHTTNWSKEQPKDEASRTELLTSSVGLLRGLADRFPGYSFLWKLLVDRLTQLEQWESAAAAQERYLRLVPVSAASHNMLAGLLLKAGRRLDAIHAFRKAIEQAADPTVYRTNLAAILIEEKMFDAAEEQLCAAEREKPMDLAASALRDRIGELRNEEEQATAKQQHGIIRRMLGWIKKT